MNPATHCSHCGTVLDAMARRRGAACCQSARCWRLQAGLRLAHRQRELAAHAKALALDQLSARPGPEAQVVWLEAWDSHLVSITEAERAVHRTALQACLKDATENSIDSAPEPIDSAPEPIDASSQPPQAVRLCAHCGGHCCRPGARHQGFIDAAVLARWQRARPGTTTDDAVQAYVDALPDRHVQDSCLYHGAGGCTLQRADRSETCNRYACKALQQVEADTGATPGRAFLVLTAAQDGLSRAARIDADATHALDLEQRPRQELG